MDSGTMLSLAELAEHLGKTRQCLYQWRARDVFPFRTYGSGRKLRVSRDEVDAYVAEFGAVPGRPPASDSPAPTLARELPTVSRNGSGLEIPLGDSVTLMEAGELVRRIQEGAELSVVLGESGCSLRIKDH